MKDIILQYQGKIRAVIRKLTGSENEDIEQEVYIKAWRNMDNYEDKGKFSQWICMIAANVCRDYFRSRQYKISACSVSSEDVINKVRVGGRQEEIVDAKSRQKIILKAVDDLPKKMRQVVVWHEFEELSIEQIAKKLGVSEGTVKSRLFNARKVLSEKLQFLKGE